MYHITKQLEKPRPMKYRINTNQLVPLLTEKSINRCLPNKRVNQYVKEPGVVEIKYKEGEKTLIKQVKSTFTKKIFKLITHRLIAILPAKRVVASDGYKKMKEVSNNKPERFDEKLYAHNLRKQILQSDPKLKELLDKEDIQNGVPIELPEPKITKHKKRMLSKVAFKSDYSDLPKSGYSSLADYNKRYLPKPAPKSTR